MFDSNFSIPFFRSMAVPSIFRKEDKETKDSTDNVYGKSVVLFNDNVNYFGHVVQCLEKICKKSEKEAQRITKEAHDTGKAICYKGSYEACETVAEAMAANNLTVEIQ